MHIEHCQRQNREIRLLAGDPAVGMGFLSSPANIRGKNSVIRGKIRDNVLSNGHGYQLNGNLT